jgi:hypothetical protein
MIGRRVFLGLFAVVVADQAEVDIAAAEPDGRLRSHGEVHRWMAYGCKRVKVGS